MSSLPQVSSQPQFQNYVPNKLCHLINMILDITALIHHSMKISHLQFNLLLAHFSQPHLGDTLKSLFSSCPPSEHHAPILSHLRPLKKPLGLAAQELEMKSDFRADTQKNGKYDTELSFFPLEIFLKQSVLGISNFLNSQATTLLKLTNNVPEYFCFLQLLTQLTRTCKFLFLASYTILELPFYCLPSLPPTEGSHFELLAT